MTNSNDKLVKNLIISESGIETIFNIPRYGCAGILMFQYLVRRCCNEAKPQISEADLKVRFGISERAIQTIRQKFEADNIIESGTGEKNNTRWYRIKFEELAKLETLRLIYNTSGVTHQKLTAIQKEYSKLFTLQNEYLKNVENTTKVDVDALTKGMVGYLDFLWTNNQEKKEVEENGPVVIQVTSTAKRRLKEALKRYSAYQIENAFKVYSITLCGLQWGLAHPYLNDIEIKYMPNNPLEYFLAYDRQKARYDLIERSLNALEKEASRRSENDSKKQRVPESEQADF